MPEVGTMTPQRWDTDEAVVTVEGDPADEAVPWRYGVTGWETGQPEPLDLALAQELPDPDVDVEDDEQWTLVDGPESFPGRLVADEAVADDDYALVVENDSDFSAEELAMHVVMM
jgi:hypothetical protein